MSLTARTRFKLTIFLALSATSSASNEIHERAPGLSIERSQAKVVIQGDLSSIGNEQILRQNAALRFPDSKLNLDFAVTAGLPPTWSLITDLTLRALAETSSASAEITPQRIVIRGYTLNSAAWYTALGRLEMHLPAEMTLDSTVAPLKSRQSFNSVCRGLFAAAFRAQRIDFARGSKILSSNAYSLLDELTELGSDCPDAAIQITGNGDGGVGNQNTGLQRATAVLAYLQERGLDPARLSAIGAVASSNRRIVFSVSF